MYIESLALVLAEKSTDGLNPYVVDKTDILSVYIFVYSCY